jgi:hypothetical protein
VCTRAASFPFEDCGAAFRRRFSICLFAGWRSLRWRNGMGAR